MPSLEHQQDLAPGNSHLSVAPAPGTPGREANGGAGLAAPVATRKHLTAQDYVQGVLAGDLSLLARAITLIESNSKKHAATARAVLTQLMPHTGQAIRVGITGVPGVGKSTTIDQLGVNLCNAGHKVAVLTIDPTSGVTGGSILGDKTRMARLAVNDRAFIRPSPSGATLGGVARKTRETMLICEAAGFDVILVETVGVGQSEVVVSEMTDTFVAFMLAGAGDELQGIKRGIIEMADILAINKADGDNIDKAKRAAMDLKHATHYMQSRTPGSTPGAPGSADWSTPVLTISGATNKGLDDLWQDVIKHRKALSADGTLEGNRRTQMLAWTWGLVEEQLKLALRETPAVRELLETLEPAIANGQVPPTVGADQILEAFGNSP